MIKQKDKVKFNAIYLAVAIVIIVSFFVGTFAWFSASTSKTDEMSFANISLELGQNGTKLTDSTFQTSYLGTITPGDTIEFSNLSVKNTGNVAIYSLLQLNVGVTAQGYEKINFTSWYNLNGEKVFTTNLLDNTTGATLVDKESTITTNLSHTFNGDEFDNHFKNANIDISIVACGVQSYLPQVSEFPEDDLYAVKLIVDDNQTNPSTYTRLEYIEGTGSQYLLLDYYPNHNTEIEIEYSTSNLMYNWVFGGRTNYLNSACGLYLENDNHIRYVYGTYGKETDMIQVDNSLNTKYHDKFVKNLAMRNGSAIAYAPNQTFESTGKMAVFTMCNGSNVDNRMFKGKIYYFTIAEGGNVLINLIPVLDSSGVACMYDTVNQKFYYNKGSGNFNYQTTEQSGTHTVNFDSENLFNGIYSMSSYECTINKQEIVDGVNVTIKTITETSNTRKGFYVIRSNISDLVIGEKYTWSVDIKSTNPHTFDATGHEQGGRRSIDVTSEWQTFTHTFTAVSGKWAAFTLYANSTSPIKVGEVVSIKNLVIQKCSDISFETAIHEIKVNGGDTYGTLPTPVKTGYVFVGWYTSPVGGTKITADSKYTKAGDSTLYAHWMQNVTLNGNGVSLTDNARTVLYNSTYGNNVNIYPSDSVSNFTSLNLGTTLKNNIFTFNYANTGTSTNYANFFTGMRQEYIKVGQTYTYIVEVLSWEGDNLTIYIGDTLPKTNTTQLSYKTKEITSTGTYFLTLNGVREGSCDLLSRDFIKIPAGTTLKGQIRISLFAGVVTEDEFSYVAPYTELKLEMPSPSRDGYRFLGWFTAQDGGVLVTSNTVYDKSNYNELYAHWEQI